MAVAQYEKLLKTDRENWYTTFTTFITNYGGGTSNTSIESSKLSSSLRNDYARASDVNNLQAVIDSFWNDEYLMTASSASSNFWPKGSTVSTGQIIYPAAVSNILTTINNMSQVKCRNKATQTNGYDLNTTYNNGNYTVQCSYGSCRSGSHSRAPSRICSNGGNRRGYWRSGYCRNGTKTNGRNSNGYNTSGTYSSQGYIDCSSGTGIEIFCNENPINLND